MLISLSLSREELKGLLWVMNLRSMRDTERDDRVLRKLHNRLIKMKKKSDKESNR